MMGKKRLSGKGDIMKQDGGYNGFISQGNSHPVLKTL